MREQKCQKEHEQVCEQNRNREFWKEKSKGEEKKVQSEKTALLIIQKYSGSNRISASNENGISNKVMIFMKSGVVSG